MQIALHLLPFGNQLALVINYACPASPLLIRACRSLVRPRSDASAQLAQLSRLRIKVLRRDRYRCRGCDKKGDEITLSLYRLEEPVLRPDRAISLCVPCHEVATQERLTGRSLPDFLRNLWRHRLPEHNNGPRRLAVQSGGSPQSQMAAAVQAQPSPALREHLVGS